MLCIFLLSRLMTVLMMQCTRSNLLILYVSYYILCVVCYHFILIQHSWHPLPLSKNWFCRTYVSLHTSTGLNESIDNNHKHSQWNLSFGISFTPEIPKAYDEVDQGSSDVFCFQKCECNGSVHVAARCSVFSDRSTPQCRQDW